MIDSVADDVVRAARALLDERLNERMVSVRALTAARLLRDTRRQELLVAEREDAAAHAAALRAGWTVEELRKVGLDEPTRRAPGRPPRPSRPSRGSDSASPRDAQPPVQDHAGGTSTAAGETAASGA